MLFVFVIGAPLVHWVAEHNALSFFPGETIADPLKRSTALREISNVASGQHSGEISAEAQAGAAAFSNAITWGGRIMLIVGTCSRWCGGLMGREPRFDAVSRPE